MTPARKARLTAAPTPSARIIRPSGTLHVYPAVVWGVRLCQAEGLRMDVEMMQDYAEAALDLLGATVDAYRWRARRRLLAR